MDLAEQQYEIDRRKEEILYKYISNEVKSFEFEKQLKEKEYERKLMNSVDKIKPEPVEEHESEFNEASYFDTLFEKAKDIYLRIKHIGKEKFETDNKYRGKSSKTESDFTAVLSKQPKGYFPYLYLPEDLSYKPEPEDVLPYGLTVRGLFFTENGDLIVTKDGKEINKGKILCAVKLFDGRNQEIYYVETTTGKEICRVPKIDKYVIRPDGVIEIGDTIIDPNIGIVSDKHTLKELKELYTLKELQQKANRENKDVMFG